MTVDIPDKAEDWSFEAKAAAIKETNSGNDIRSEVDNLVGITDPSWEENKSQPGNFTKYELTLLLLALGWPQ